MSSSNINIPAVNLEIQYASIRAEVDAAVKRVLDRQDFVLGEEVGELERAMSALHDCEHAVGCASGSDALLLSLLALGIGAGDSVIVPALTFFATAGSVVRAGARPIFADIDPRTLNIDSAAAEAALAGARNGGPIKAVIPVHLYGQCADMDEVLALARTHGMHVIEDAAQAVLAEYRGRASGSMGIAGCFSFYPTKNLSAAGDAGMITTRDASMAERLRILRNHGSADRIRYTAVGLNSRLDTLQAAILLVKLKHIGEWTAARRERAGGYRRLFEEIFGGGAGRLDRGAVYPTPDCPVVLPLEQRSGEHVYHQFTIRALRRDELAARLRGQGIGTAVYYPVALHQQPALQRAAHGVPACGEAERASREVLSLPLYPELTSEQQQRVVTAILDFYN